ncbi:MAG: RES family NAD+ phosphorylase [Amphiplicatus sp.]
MVSEEAAPVPPVSRINWNRATRIIRSVYPPIDLFEDIADPADWELIASAEAKTNSRVRDSIGKISLVPPERRVSGPGASYVMAPFTHVSPERPTRFSAGTFGVYYCGDRFEVALRETVYHFGRFMRATNEEPMTADFRELVGAAKASVHDIRRDERFADCLDPDDYGAAQRLGKTLRDEHDSDGIVYRSVRHPKGFALAAFWPDVVSLPQQARHLAYRWNGDEVDAWFVYGEDDWRNLG